jgi:hypothetical protein
MPATYEQIVSAEHLRKDLAQSAIAKVGSKCYGFIVEAALGLRKSSAETRLKRVQGAEHAVGVRVKSNGSSRVE